ncbi:MULTISPECIES: hypothetical protein [Gordonia]|uniref:Uncharacterized protein n=1 Tax=Gordonia amicalis TaxID=89053 RepID=A0AAE4QZI6_9ACTN|nr:MULTISPECIES: hypothetical protein [Gordonia]MCZ4577771.1 hypothetical protein [Gordonia amicalis]MCZ4652391.1 hypothetical protein [Gordonia amicalis]MDJ0451234.1 hypothetical protein [Gordonia amicalis]MDV6310595.1 hypothetical protein [Gordonia amicalis]MDV7074616.1 hypothetical protein [Gordonia amicalis]
MTTSFDPNTPPPPEAFRESRRRDPDPYELDRPPMSRAEIAAANRDTEARNSDARMARETARANALVVPQRAPRSVAQHPMTPKLADAGEVGATVLDLVRYRHAEGALSRALSRVDEESREMTARIKADNLRARTTDAAAAALDAAEKREKVPPTLAPLIDWQRDRIDHIDQGVESTLRKAIERGAAERAEAAVVAVLAEIDAAVIEEAGKVLRDAAQAHKRLNLAGLTVDADAGELVDAGDDGALSALRLWRSAVSRWEHVQAVRMWVAAVLDRGFEVHRGVLRVVPPPRVKVGDFVTDEQAREHNSPQAEARTQGAQWEGSTAPRAVGEGSSHTALRWWCGLDEGSRPAPRGVLSEEGN